MASHPDRDIIRKFDRLPGHRLEDVYVGRPIEAPVEAVRHVWVVVSGRDEYALGREPRKLAGNEVAGVGARSLVFVEVSADGDGIHIELQREIDDTAESGAELFAPLGCLARRHAEAGEGTVQVEVGEVQDTNHLGQTLDKCSSFVNRNFVEIGGTNPLVPLVALAYHAAMSGPHAGIKVVDFTEYIAGPYCTMLLADMGADVVKVERPEGDAWRHTAPVAPYEGRGFPGGNRRTRSVALDLERPEGRQIAQRLALEADVVTIAYRPGVARRPGLDFETLSKTNPQLVYCEN